MALVKLLLPGRDDTTIWAKLKDAVSESVVTTYFPTVPIGRSLGLSKDKIRKELDELVDLEKQLLVLKKGDAKNADQVDWAYDEPTSKDKFAPFVVPTLTREIVNKRVNFYYRNRMFSGKIEKLEGTDDKAMYVHFNPKTILYKNDKGDWVDRCDGNLIGEADDPFRSVDLARGDATTTLVNGGTAGGARAAPRVEVVTRTYWDKDDTKNIIIHQANLIFPEIEARCQRFHQFIALVRSAFRLKDVLNDQRDIRQLREIMSDITKLFRKPVYDVNGTMINPITHPYKMQQPELELSEKIVMGERHLHVKWMHLPGRIFFVNYKITKYEGGDTTTVTGPITIACRNGSCNIKVPEKNKVDVEVRVKMRGYADTEQGVADNDIWGDITPETYRFYSQPVETRATSSFTDMFDVDTFRLKIEGRYKTVFDVFEAFPNTYGKNESLEDCLDTFLIGMSQLSKYIYRIGAVPWEHFKIPLNWNKMNEEDRTYVILLQGTTHMNDTALMAQTSNIILKELSTEVANYGILDIMPDETTALKALPNKESDDHPVYSYKDDARYGGRQRYLTKNSYTTVNVQLAETFAHVGENTKRILDWYNFRSQKWKSGQQILKKYLNDRKNGVEYPDCLRLDLQRENESCERLRRIAPMLRLSAQMGRPMLLQCYGKPHLYYKEGNQSSARYNGQGHGNAMAITAKFHPHTYAQPLGRVVAKPTQGKRNLVQEPNSYHNQRYKRTRMDNIIPVREEVIGGERHIPNPVYPGRAKAAAQQRLDYDPDVPTSVQKRAFKNKTAAFSKIPVY